MAWIPIEDDVAVKSMKTAISLKVDSEIKVKAQELAKSIGIPLSTIINGFLCQFVRDEKIEFSRVYKMTPELEKDLEEIEEDIRLGKNLSKPLKNEKEIRDYLQSL